MTAILKDILDNTAAVIESMNMANVCTRIIFDQSDEGELLNPIVKIVGGRNYIEPSIYLNISSETSADVDFDIANSNEESGTYLIHREKLGYTDTEDQRAEVSKVVELISKNLSDIRYNSELTSFCESMGIEPDDCTQISISANYTSIAFNIEGDLLQISRSKEDQEGDRSVILIEAENAVDGSWLELDAMHIAQTLSGTSPDDVLENIKVFFDLITKNQDCFA